MASDLNEIIKRVASLERQQDLFWKELSEEKRENVKLEREILQINRENISLKETVKNLLENEIPALKKENVKLRDDIRELRTENMVNMETRLDEIALTKVPALSNQIKRIKSRTNNLDHEMSNLSSWSKTVDTQLEQTTGLHRALNRALVESHNVVALDKKVTDLIKITKTLQERNDNIRQSFTSINVGHRGEMRTGEFMRMDQCVNVFVSGMEDITDGSVVLKWDGVYLRVTKFYQIGEGEIEMYERWEGSDDRRYLGKTVCDRDLCCSVDVIRRNKGGRFWLEARRVKGQAKNGWCNIRCLLLSPW